MVLRTTVLGLVAGFLTRPCCVIPAVMSFTGAGAVGLSTAVTAYQGAFVSASVLLLAISTVISFCRQGGWCNKALALGGTLVGFLVALNWLRSF